MSRKGIVILYLIGDWLAAGISWLLLYWVRKELEFESYGMEMEFHFERNLLLGLVLVPLFWIVLYAAWGMYSNVMRRHRLRDVGQVAGTSIIGNLILFFVLLLDDQLPNFSYYYYTLGTLLVAHFVLTLFFKTCITTRTVHQIQRGKWGFPTVIVGGNARALQLVEEINALKKSPGFHFVGFLKIIGQDDLLQTHMTQLGKYPELSMILEKHAVEEVIISLESGDHKELERILALLGNHNVHVSIIPDTFDIVSGTVKMTSVFGVPLIRLKTDLMPTWQFSLKRFFDVLLSVMALLVLLPVFFVLALAVKLSSKGPIFFFQERVGKGGRPFQIVKFRSMYVNAEQHGPQLSSASDNRITPVGKFLRKTRFDEFPQFWNVLRGDMSLVGPRPERQFYIDQISQYNPHYHKLHRIRPGITSWGQVKYGYAENVEQMVQRLKYDLLYLENMSLAMDIKILFYTIVIVLKGSGK